MPVDLPPKLPERIVCSISAATKFEVPANIVLAVAEKENGKPGQWVRNRSNGSYDVGPLQFNTRYLQDLAKFGITASHVAVAGCYAFELAAWRLRMHIKNDRGDLWTRAANYHSRTPQFNRIYRADLMVRAARWADWLADRYPTHDVSLPGIPGSSSALAGRSPSLLASAAAAGSRTTPVALAGSHGSGHVTRPSQ